MLILGGISGAGMMSAFQEYRPIFVVLTFGLLGGAFYLTYRPQRGQAVGGTSQAPIGKIVTLNKFMLWIVTGLAVVMLFFPQRVWNLIPANGRVTADMQKTVIQIEGMT